MGVARTVGARAVAGGSRLVSESGAAAAKLGASDSETRRLHRSPVADPLLAWSIGFWLSVGATAGVVVLGPWLADRVAERLARQRRVGFGSFTSLSNSGTGMDAGLPP